MASGNVKLLLLLFRNDGELLFELLLTLEFVIKLLLPFELAKEFINVLISRAHLFISSPNFDFLK